MLPRPSVCWHVCKIVKEEGLSPCPPPDPTAASYGGSQAAGALPGLRKVEAPIAGPQVFSKLVRAMGVLVPLSERFSAGGEETSSGTATVHSTAATAAAVSKTSKISWSHAGAISWSRVPGFCGFCRAPTSCWSCPTGDPPWLPLSPQPRVHLRLLWDFYAASLPTSCSSMQEAIRMDNIFALRAEAALLSLISRALGFTSLSQSSLRVAEICDINDAGEPNPAWGRNHPLAGAKWTHLFCLDTSAAKLVVQEQQHKRQHQQQQQKIGSRHSNHCRTSVELGGEQLHEDTYMGEGASVSQCRTPVAGARCVSSSSEVLDTLVSAERPADSEVPAEIIRAAGAVNSPFAMACSKQALERLAAVTPHQRTQQRHCCSAKQNASWRGQDQLTKEQQQTYPLSRQPPRQQQVQWQCLSRYSKQQATQGHKKHREWHLPKHSPAACLRGLNSPTGALGEAVAVCFADLHAAKAKLAPLFQEGALEAATEASAVVLNDEAAPQLTNPAGGQCSYLQPLHNSTETLTGIASALRSWTKATEATLEETRTSGRIIATAVTTAVTTAVVATKAAIAAAKSALKRALVWGGSGADAVGGLVSSATVDAVMWLPSPVSVAEERVDPQYNA
ncbi:hypothetical protein EMWEY_00038450 [Eimeria maxima]|uniref:Uncharacterized protein n=1 Tax=Eimeria maxima TaxID=5804 RepID=U6MAB5_EIMMA|nr:hypothetical protein EMWEY_00038450 [Eimeria maxima]CDJ61142.1 hypothetical protein EMWEY_00038450 [Eimeria maxima]